MKKFIPVKSILILIIFISVFQLYSSEKTILPVKDPSAFGYRELQEGQATVRVRGIRNLFSIDELQQMIKGGSSNGLVLDLTGHKKLLDGRVIDPLNIYGRIYTAPYPFEGKEVKYTYKRFRLSSKIKNGKGIIPLKYYFKTWLNSEDWINGGQVVIRINLKLKTDSEDVQLGIYDTFVRFKKTGDKFYKELSLTEGPLINLVSSDHPDYIVISFKTSEPSDGFVKLKDGKTFGSDIKLIRHEIKVSGLKPDHEYKFNLIFSGIKSKVYNFKTAPRKGEGEIVFAYSGDCREGAGGGDRTLMGMNYFTMERIANQAYLKKSNFIILGGDLVNGRTASIDDFKTQLYIWKQSLSGFWHHSPVYTCIGNHEALLKFFVNKKSELIMLDRWPYNTQSVEAVFAKELVQPQNAPDTSDKNRPSYSENVYSFTYGQVKIIVFNNNYWISKTRGTTWKIPERFGGCPEGYIFDDQMQWIEKELNSAESDPDIKYIILFAQEPVFPNGGHIGDSMWYDGDNGSRAFTYNPETGKIKKEKKGIIEVRNRFVRMISKNKKVAAVLGSDEHAFHKVLIDKNVPIGNLKKDIPIYKNGKFEKLKSISPLSDLKYPVWYLVSGGGGAPYYSAQESPWNKFWKENPKFYPQSKHTSKKGCFYYSSQENFMLFKADNKKISVTIYNPYGEMIDKIDDLMAVKK